MKIKSIMAGLAFVAVPATAYGQDTVAAVDVVPEAAAEPVVLPTDTPLALAAASVAPSLEAVPAGTDDTILADDALNDQRGGQAIVIGNQTLNAVNSGSTINGNYTAGAVAISDNALSNFNGLGNVLINTGALNNLQSAMNVTINIAN
jgi:hypothetical protein